MIIRLKVKCCDHAGLYDQNGYVLSRSRRVLSLITPTIMYVFSQH